MTLTVKFFASVREIVGARSLVAEAPEGSTVASLWQSYVEKYPRLRDLGVAYAVNQQYTAVTHALRDGDEVAFIPPVSGG